MAGEGLARGLPAWAMRMVAVRSGEENLAGARVQLRWAVLRILRLAAVVGILVGAGLALLGSRLETNYLPVVFAALLGAPLFALLRLGAEALKGAGGALQAVTIENLVIPAVLLTVCVLFWLGGTEVGMPTILGAGLAGIALALLFMVRAFLVQARRAVQAGPAVAHGAHATTDINALWANSVLSVTFVQLPFLVLPVFATAEEIGVYAVAHKLVNVVTTLLILLAAVFGPAFARAAAAGDARALQALLRRTQLISCVIFLPFCAALLLAGDLLARLFNVPATTLELYLFILVAGQLVNAATGLSGVLLNMAGAARLETHALLAALVITAVAAPPVGAVHGAPGLALLLSAVIAVKNSFSYLAARLFLSRGEDSI